MTDELVYKTETRLTDINKLTFTKGKRADDLGIDS